VACFSPLSAWQTDSGDIVFVERGSIRRALQLACGQCIGCRLERSRQWAVRCLHESQLYEQNCFITLTYDDKHFLPSLVYKDFQDFMKRFRERFSCFDVVTWRWVPRFFMCGEYGEQFGRPHFHACIFGYDFPDKVLYRTLGSGFKLYRSDLLASLWDVGYSSVGAVSFESAAYVARYICKKVTGPRAVKHYSRVDAGTGECFSVVPEFTHMSLKPGIGRGWIERYLDEVYDNDYVVINGMKCRPPKYYDSYLKEVRPSSFEYLEVPRVANAVLHGPDCTPARLADREVVARARLAFKRRTLE
jgi:hypothetical protein